MIQECYIENAFGKIIPIIPIIKNDLTVWIKTQPKRIKNLTQVNKFVALKNTHCLILNEAGNLESVLLGIATKNDYLTFGLLPQLLPAGKYQIKANNFTAKQLELAAIGWGLGSYLFTKYKERAISKVKLILPKNKNSKHINNIVAAIYLVRDLINTPVCDMHPNALALVAKNIAKSHQAKFKEYSGKALMRNFPAVYAVGKASINQPKLIKFDWGKKTHKKVVLVGKGVCFDSGGLNIKSPESMLLMKKDMAGAAHALGLAKMIMSENLPIQLSVIIPIVENVISSNSYKPGDVIKTRSGQTIEILNTDAEGRVILADALTLASKEKPNLLIDFATLTQAARAALGPNIPAMFSNDDAICNKMLNCLSEEQEAAWKMPLYQPYAEFIKSRVADLTNVATAGYLGAGAIIAALFLQKFVDKNLSWVHFDMSAYNFSATPGKAVGGEAMCLRGLFRYLAEYFTQES
ncbi:MAG: leucyl aminopeptidase family protein [Gammaproteobacteria bacterium]|nr:leucyl aminopeptidase family protein [Gammaproteobacteria bacterium]